jgi:hypothetical protein
VQERPQEVPVKKTALLLSALAAASVAGQAQAQTRGGYFGIGALSASTDNARDFALAYGGTAADKTASGMKIYGGYLWNRFGIEGGYYDLGSYEVITGTQKSDDFKVSAFTVSGVFAMPLGNNFTFGGKLGLAFTSAKYRCYLLSCTGTPDTSESDIAAIFGAGIGWRPAPNFTLRADLESIGDVSHAAGLVTAQYPYTILSVSAQFNF